MNEVLKLIIILLVALPVIVVTTQDLQIFPSLVHTLFEDRTRDDSTLPPLVESFFVNTHDNREIEVWAMVAKEDSPKGVILTFHGNGETNDSAFHAQSLFAQAGYNTYQFDYRGIGKSSGWPRESKIYRDSETIIAEIARREEIHPQEVILVGNSIGTGPASNLATKVKSKHLILLAPYTSIPDIVRGIWPHRFLTPFLWWDFPVGEYVADLKETSLIVAHGKLDNIIPFELGQRVVKSYQGNGKLNFIALDRVSHNDLFINAFPKVIDTLEVHHLSDGK